MNSPIIELQNLKKYYGKNKGIEDVSIKINKGEIYGFMALMVLVNLLQLELLLVLSIKMVVRC